MMRNDTKYKLLKSILEGKVIGERTRMRWFLKRITELFRVAVNKVIIAKMISNI
jgi:hypothetical protein